jgi:hypothetical protein
MLLQSSGKTCIICQVGLCLKFSGFLDVDKLIEYRPPEDIASSWMRPVAPQRELTTQISSLTYLSLSSNTVTLLRFDDCHMPMLQPLSCHSCRSIIRGSMFQRKEDTSKKICESCYWENHYGSDRYVKMYKHCILRHAISKNDSQMICHCSTVRHIDPDGIRRNLFPVDAKDRHRGMTQNNIMKCGLLHLGTLVAEAKYQGMLSNHEKRVSLGDQKHIHEAWEVQQRRETAKAARAVGPHLKVYEQPSLVDTSDRMAEAGRSTALEESRADENVPFFLREFVNKFPFGNVHMALRIGPLVIENGARR